MTIQPEVYVILLITIVICILMVVLSKKIDKQDPFEKPKGICLPTLILVEMVYKNVKDSVGKRYADALTPYILCLWCFIFISNIISLVGMTSPTSNFSVTLTLSFLTWLLIQIAEFRFQGVKAYFHGFIEPIPVMLPMNIIGKFSTMASMALRLFGNILCGGIMMSLVYSFAQFLSNSIIGIFTTISGDVFNFMGPVIAPLLHCYFDLFAGFVQTLVFVTLTMVLLGNDIPDEYKN